MPQIFHTSWRSKKLTVLTQKKLLLMSRNTTSTLMYTTIPKEIGSKDYLKKMNILVIIILRLILAKISEDNKGNCKTKLQWGIEQ